jgi:hypothetical protein
MAETALLRKAQSHLEPSHLTDGPQPGQPPKHRSTIQECRGLGAPGATGAATLALRVQCLCTSAVG